MHVSKLVELGAYLAAEGHCFIEYQPLLTAEHLHQYWLASRCRHEYWFSVLKAHEQAASALQRERWPLVQSVIADIIASELLTRTWTAAACVYDREQQSGDYELPTSRVLESHVEARSRALNILVSGRGVPAEDGEQLNRLYHQTESWTDKMLAYLAVDAAVDQFAFRADRMQTFAEDVRHEHNAGTGMVAWELTRGALRATFGRLVSDERLATFHARIAGSILACCHSDLLDVIDTTQSHRILRLNHVADNAERLVHALLRAEDAAARQSVLARR